MEKRYQVFVSSTFVDLQEERRQVMQALLELDCIPAGMELFPAADETQWALIQRVIDDRACRRLGPCPARGVSRADQRTSCPGRRFESATPSSAHSAAGRSRRPGKGKRQILHTVHL